MTQDQGVYQTEAIQIVSQNYKAQHDFEEYRLLEADVDREQYKRMVRQAYNGFYSLNTYYPTAKPRASIQ